VPTYGLDGLAAEISATLVKGCRVIIFVILFWLSATVLFAVYLGYPLSMPVLAKLFRKPHIQRDATPKVTQVISAYNEINVIQEKIENSLALDYPRAQLEILVISDACDDGTDEVVQQFNDSQVQLKRQDERGGKSRGLSRFVPQATGEIIVFSDANSMYDKSAIQKLVRHFADPTIGYVVGHQRYVDDRTSLVSESEQAYWDYEIRLKQYESDLSSVVGGDGAIYAIRAELFSELEDDDINDFVNPLQIVARGYRGIFDAEAFCYEESARSFDGEFRRKTRIVNRAFRGLRRVPAVLNPLKSGWFAYQILLHKLLRWFSPYFALGTFFGALGAIYTGGSEFYVIVLTLQLSIVGIGLLRFFPPLANVKIILLTYYVCMSNIAAIWGTLKAFNGEKFTIWKPER
jgi:cellulose synthase/poly-beta-1,6-N-acetylglucosamine synthase-like glycosyltransferase